MASSLVASNRYCQSIQVPWLAFTFSCMGDYVQFVLIVYKVTGIYISLVTVILFLIVSNVTASSLMLLEWFSH